MSNVSVIVAVLIAASLTGDISAQMMGMSPSSAPSGAPDCMSNLFNMTDCLSYVQVGEGTGGAAKPDKACCPELAGLVESSPQCLCYLLGGDVAAQYGIKIDKAKALKLPGVCGVQTPDPSLCSLFGFPVGVPVGAPVGIGNEVSSSPPSLAPGGPISGAEAPVGFASGPSTVGGDAPSTAPYSLFLSLLLILVSLNY